MFDSDYTYYGNNFFGTLIFPLHIYLENNDNYQNAHSGSEYLVNVISSLFLTMYLFCILAS